VNSTARLGTIGAFGIVTGVVLPKSVLAEISTALPERELWL
jgi:hypothetical protein